MANSKTRQKQGKGDVSGQGFAVHPENINRKGRPTIAQKQRELDERIEKILKKNFTVGNENLSGLDFAIEKLIRSNSPQGAINILDRYYGKAKDNPQLGESQSITNFSIPADVISPSFFETYRDVKIAAHLEYVETGGRGSTKSSFVSVDIIEILINNPDINAVIMRQVGETLRGSVYAQMLWAIEILNLTDMFHSTLTPMEIEYIPTGQRIYFRGADDPGKIKSIKTPHGYIGILWLEELDQFKGEEAVRKIEQSIIRGGDKAYIFKSFNPPPTANNWANKYLKIPKENRRIHYSTYLDVPPDWLGKPFIDEAEWLKVNNPKAYNHEYLGQPTNSDSVVFENLEIRAITDEEIRQFDQIGQGIDWGYYPDCFAWTRSHYDSARRILYIFDEYKALKSSNQKTYQYLVDYKHAKNGEEIIADSAEPKSVADYYAWGMNIHAAEKGPESVRYSYEWLQGINKIVIDPVRCPYSSQEFLDYEYERDPKTDEIVSGYPDKNNHFIDSTRYRTNRIWKRRGQ